MSYIVFLPHCSKCGALIDGEVGIRKEILRGLDDFPVVSTQMQPYKCENCGERFDHLITPNQNPNSKYWDMGVSYFKKQWGQNK